MMPAGRVKLPRLDRCAHVCGIRRSTPPTLSKCCWRARCMRVEVTADPRIQRIQRMHVTTLIDCMLPAAARPQVSINRLRQMEGK